MNNNITLGLASLFAFALLLSPVPGLFVNAKTQSLLPLEQQRAFHAFPLVQSQPFNTIVDIPSQINPSPSTIPLGVNRLGITSSSSSTSFSSPINLSHNGGNSVSPQIAISG